MAFLRGLGTAILSFLLFVALAAFSMAFLINSTVLNPDFMNRQIDKLDISAIANDTVKEQLTSQLPKDNDFLNGVATTLIGQEEPLIKEQAHNAVNTAYSYFLGKQDNLKIVFSLTGIKQDLNKNLWQSAVDYLKTKLAGMTDAQVNQYVKSIREQIPADILPSALAALPADQRNAVIDEYIKELGGRGTTQGAATLINLLLKDQIKSYFNQYCSEFISSIPDTYTVDESSMNTDTINTVRQVKDITGYFKNYYLYLIGIMIVLAGLIFLINWSNLRVSVRSLGIDILVFGALDLIGVVILMKVHPETLIPDYESISPSLQTWIEGLIKDVTGIMIWFSIGVLVIGAALLVASFFIRKQEALEQA